MGADSDMVKGALTWTAGSAADKADRELRFAAHAYHTASPERKQAARQALRLAAVAFTAAAQEPLPKGAR